MKNPRDLIKELPAAKDFDDMITIIYNSNIIDMIIKEWLYHNYNTKNLKYHDYDFLEDIKNEIFLGYIKYIKEKQNHVELYNTDRKSIINFLMNVAKKKVFHRSKNGIKPQFFIEKLFEFSNLKLKYDPDDYLK